MRFAASVRHSLYVIACVATATFGADAFAADAAQVRNDLAAVLDQTFNTPGEPVLTYDSIDIAGQAAPFEVSIRGVKLGSPAEGFADLGTVTMTIAPAGEGLYDISNVKLPGSITHTAPADAPEGAGAVDATIEIGEQSFAGRWSMPMRSFLQFDGNVGALRALDDKGNVVLTLGRVLLKGDTTEKGASRWDQVASFTLSDMQITSPEDGVQVSLAEVSAGTEARDIDLVSFQALMDKIDAAGASMAPEAVPMPEPMSPEEAPAESGQDDQSAAPESGAASNLGADQAPSEETPSQSEPMDEGAPELATPEPTTPEGAGPSAEMGQMTPQQAQAMQEIMDALQGIPGSIGDAASNIAIRGLSVRDADGKEMFKLDTGGIDFSVSDLDQEKSGMRFAYSHTGLDADWNIFNSDEEDDGEFTFGMEGESATPEAAEPAEPEPLDAQTEQLIDELAPREFAIDIRLADVPTKQLWSTFVSTIYSGASEGAVDSQMEMMGMMLPMMLAQAGSTVRIVDTRIVTQAARMAIDGEVKADPASMMGASGTLTVEITGLDKVIDLVKGYVGPEAAAETAPLEMLRAFGERTQSEGETVDRYVVTLEPNGALMVNGKDMNFLLGGGGEGGGEGGGGEMPQP